MQSGSPASPRSTSGRAGAGGGERPFGLPRRALRSSREGHASQGAFRRPAFALQPRSLQAVVRLTLKA